MASCWKTELLRAVMASGSIGSGGRLACCCSWPQSALHNERQCLRRDVNVCATTNKASVDEKYTIDVADVLSLCLSVSLSRALSLSLDCYVFSVSLRRDVVFVLHLTRENISPWVRCLSFVIGWAVSTCIVPFKRAPWSICCCYDTETHHCMPRHRSTEMHIQ